MPKLKLRDNRDYDLDKTIEVSDDELGMVKVLNKKFRTLKLAAEMNPDAKKFRDMLAIRPDVTERIYETTIH